MTTWDSKRALELVGYYYRTSAACQPDTFDEVLSLLRAAVAEVERWRKHVCNDPDDNSVWYSDEFVSDLKADLAAERAAVTNIRKTMVAEYDKLARELRLARAVVEAARELADVSHYEWCDVLKGAPRTVPPRECDCGVRTFKNAIAAYDAHMQTKGET